MPVVAATEPASSSRHHAPLTFEDRGAAVPFTTLALLPVRVRACQNGLETMLPGLAETRATFVFGWAALPEMVKMTVHDRMLHREIERGRLLTPSGIREAAQVVACSGLAGPRVAAVAAQRARDHESLVTLTQFALITRAIEQLSPARTRVALQELSDARGQQRAKGLLGEIAGRYGINGETLYARLERWGAAVARVGMVGMPLESPMRRLSKRLAELSVNLVNWAARGEGEFIDEARTIGEVASETNEMLRVRLGRLDLAANRVADILSAWEPRIAEVERHVERIDWLVDGWERIVQLWTDVAPEPLWCQNEAIETIVRILPIVPERELEEVDRARWSAYAAISGAAFQRADPSAGRGFDIEGVLRLEQHKIRAI